MSPFTGIFCRCIPAFKRGRRTSLAGSLKLAIVVLLGLCGLLLFFPVHAANALGCSTQAGGPSCGASNPGSSNQSWLSNHHVGNPVDTISGNKYQRELDYQAFGSSLSLVRHYNSGLAGHNLHIGPGWRHSYHVVLSRIDTDTLQVVQSDGRRVQFYLDKESGRYLPEASGDGYLVENEYYEWELPDGRTMRFSGSWLVAIDYPDDARSGLTLHYDKERLATVRDGWGRELQFSYHSGALGGLGFYDDKGKSKSPGALAFVTLPNGWSIKYEYDHKGNLSAVYYPGEWAVLYGYSGAEKTPELKEAIVGSNSNHSGDSVQTKNAEGHPHHLTERLVKGLLRTWVYDGDGRVVSHDFGDGRAAMKFSYSVADELATTGTTSIGTGEQTQLYHWRLDPGTGERWVDAVVEKRCDECEEKVYKYPSPGERLNTVKPPSGKSGSGDQHVEQAGGSYGRPFMFEAKVTERPVILSVNGNEVLIELPDGEKLPLIVNRTGEIVDFERNGVSYFDLKLRARRGELQKCEKRRLPDELVRGEPCFDDYLWMHDLSVRLEDFLAAPPSALKVGHRGTRGGAAPQTTVPSPFCTLPTGVTCTQLEIDFEMAVLSECAYDTAPCQSNWVEVQPASIGLSPDMFDFGDFSASLYRDPVSGEYVLSFRGTDDIVRDAPDNLGQYLGLSTDQYRRAVVLAKNVLANISSASLSFTGHSLGGGLATAASLAVNQDSTTFNAAALTESSANALGLSYGASATLVRNYFVEGEFVTNFQAREDVCPYPNRIGGGYRPIPLCIDNYGNLVQPMRFPPPGVQIEIPRPYSSWISQTAVFYYPQSIEIHFIAAVIESMRTQLLEACGVVV